MEIFKGNFAPEKIAAAPIAVTLGICQTSLDSMLIKISNSISILQCRFHIPPFNYVICF